MADGSPKAGGQGGTREPRLLLRIGTASCSSQAPPADQPVTTGPKAPATTSATGRSPATTMPSSPRQQSGVRAGAAATSRPGECGPANMAAVSLASSKAKVLRSAQQPAFVGVCCPETV